MATRKQVRANRENARKSTGPRTDQGKATSRLNAVRHGILAKTPIVPNLELEEDWDAHRGGLLESLQPLGKLEAMLADRVIELSWRVQRIARYERDEIAKFYAEDAPKFFRDMEEMGVAGGRQLPDLKMLGPLTRYEAHLHRSLMQTLHELQRVQAKRIGGDSVAPLAVDVVITDGPGGANPEQSTAIYETNPLSRN